MRGGGHRPEGTNKYVIHWRKIGTVEQYKAEFAYLGCGGRGVAMSHSWGGEVHD